MKERMEDTLTEGLRAKSRQCLEQLRDAYERQGYSATLGASGGFEVTIVPGSILLNMNTPLTITKDATRTFRSFSVSQPSQYYDLLYIVTSIIDYETTLGGSETTAYLQYYPDLKLDKAKLDDGSTVYRVSNVVTKETFQFASRSLVFPPGDAFAR